MSRSTCRSSARAEGEPTAGCLPRSGVKRRRGLRLLLRRRLLLCRRLLLGFPRCHFVAPVSSGHAVTTLAGPLAATAPVVARRAATPRARRRRDRSRPNRANRPYRTRTRTRTPHPPMPRQSGAQKQESCAAAHPASTGAGSARACADPAASAKTMTRRTRGMSNDTAAGPSSAIAPLATLSVPGRARHRRRRAV